MVPVGYTLPPMQNQGKLSHDNALELLKESSNAKLIRDLWFGQAVDPSNLGIQVNGKPGTPSPIEILEFN